MEQFVGTEGYKELSESPVHARTLIKNALQTTYGITLLHTVLADEAGQAMLQLLKNLATDRPDPEATAFAYTQAFRALALVTDEYATLPIPDAWQAYLVTRLIDDSNPWSRQVERTAGTQISPTLQAQAQRDLRALQRLFQLTARLLWNLTCAIVTPTLPLLRESWMPWYDLVSNHHDGQQTTRSLLAQQITECTDWAEVHSFLEKQWARHGTGQLARYHVLRWQGEEKHLSGIIHPDQAQLSTLVGQERQQNKLTLNIKHFMAGLPAQNMLLYGAPGTGKSSTIKAIVNAYAQQGLRLVEVHKEDLADLPSILALLRERAPRFLIFIDDLSFEEHETSYKHLKVLLEGTAEARPANVLICATTNRMNLVRENFSERGKPHEDVQWRDSMDEKQALVQRFGLRITFTSPDQEQYLSIVAELARQRGLTLPEETLRTRALQWERQYSGRSGRLARQFIDDLEADMKYHPQDQDVRI